MAGISKDQRLADIHAEALAEFDEIQKALYDERMQCLEDRRFYSIAGAQWEGDLGEQFANKPRLEFNKVHLAVIRIINEYRNNRITVDFTPKDGSTNAELADVCDGLYRADEHDSTAQEAYDNAFEEATAGGVGAWRLCADYEDDEDDENEKQRIRIEPIFDADASVFFDLDAKRQDKSDARRCYVLTSMTHAAFEAQFGEKPADWDKSIQKTRFDWCAPDLVHVAEHYRIEEKRELVHIFRGLDETDMPVPDEELKDDPEKMATLLATGFRLVRQKKVKRRVVKKYILSGRRCEQVDGEREWTSPGRHIPVVVTYGKRWFVDGIERCMGHVRLAKDAQRLQNSLLSWLTDMATRFDIEKPILSPEQINGHATMWSEDNISRYPYLLANLLRDESGNVIPGSNAPAAYTKAPSLPPAMAALIQVASAALEDLLGNQAAGEQIQPNLSGKAVELIQQRLDMQTFIYVSNFAKAMKRSGEIWLSMAKEVMVEDGRLMKTMTEDGNIDTATLRQTEIDPETDAEIVRNDLTDATFDVWVEVGPSSSSRRAAAVRALTGMASITTDEQDRTVLTSAAMMNIEGEGLRDLHDYYRAKLVRMGVVKPTKEEAAELAQQQANTPPDAQTQYLMAAAAQAEGQAALARAKTVESIASADLKAAQRVETLTKAMGDADATQIANTAALRDLLQPPEPPAPTIPGV